MPDLDSLRFPIGEFHIEGEITDATRRDWIEQLAAAAEQYRAAVKDLTPEQLDTPYRPGGWTVRQVVHHLPDSHMNSYVRYRLALTEDEPEIKPYMEDRWAELPDARTGPIEPSLELLAALHERWTQLLRSLTAEQWKRRFRHPERGVVSLDWNLGLYAWHCRHHLAHIAGLRERKGWL
jgi:hypothetical protein